MVAENNNKMKPENFQGGQIRFVRAGEGNLNGKFTIWGDSVKVRGLAHDEIRLPLDMIRALVLRIEADDDVRKFIGV